MTKGLPLAPDCEEWSREIEGGVVRFTLESAPEWSIVERDGAFVICRHQVALAIPPFARLTDAMDRVARERR